MTPAKRPAPALATVAVILTLAIAVGCSADQPRSEGRGAPSTADTGAAEDPPPGEGDGAAGQTPGADDPAGDQGRPDFVGAVQRIGPQLGARMRFSHRPGCPVPLGDLRYLRMSYVGFDGEPRAGEMVVHRTEAREVVGVFRTLYERRWPIRRMRLVDDYRGDDDRSMAANNTSGYNCRLTGSGKRWSEHAYGRAIDINPVQNPYVVGSVVAPDKGARFASLDRSADARPPKGVIVAGDVVVSEFERRGWVWGGEWVNSKDYQHFSRTGL